MKLKNGHVYHLNFRMPLYENNNMRTLTTKDLVRISLQVADAMAFIADKKVKITVQKFRKNICFK